MSRRPYIGPSDAQANAEALERRERTYTLPHELSKGVAWNWHNREPRDLRDAVRIVRAAYADEVPTKLHEGYDSIGEGGTPKMTAKAEGYIFGSATGSDAQLGKCAEWCRENYVTEAPEGHSHPYVRVHADDCPAHPKNQPLVSYYHAPFRAALERLSRGSESERKRAAIVSHVTIGSQGPLDAAVAEGVPAWCAKLVAEDAIRSFLRGLTDMKLHLRRENESLAEGVTAA